MEGISEKKKIRLSEKEKTCMDHDPCILFRGFKDRTCYVSACTRMRCKIITHVKSLWNLKKKNGRRMPAGGKNWDPDLGLWYFNVNYLGFWQQEHLLFSKNTPHSKCKLFNRKATSSRNCFWYFVSD